jgi:hypothetical protein
MKSLAVRILLVAVAILIALQFTPFPFDVGSAVLGAVIGIFLLGPVFGALGAAVESYTLGKRWVEILGQIDRLLESDVDRARKFIAAMREAK